MKSRVKKRILVHDDDKVLVKGYVRKLQNLKALREDFDVEPLDVTAFRDEMSILAGRQRAMRDGKRTYSEKSLLDTADVFVVDFDLLQSDTDSVWTSEIVAYLARCFSTCGLIVGLNLPNCHEFDLSLRGNLTSYADLNIVSKHLSNERLWDGSLADSFRPWYWPKLLDYIEAFEKKTKDVEENLNKPILNALGFEDITKMLPRTVTEFIDGKSMQKTTFRQFVRDSSNALHRRDRNPDVKTICKIAAARVSKWIERRVLPGQNIVVDAPHLISRYPSLLKGKHSMLKTWNGCAMFAHAEELNLNHALIREFQHSKPYWFSRPVWFWRKLAELVGIKEVSAPWQKERLQFRFCEDASRFYDKRVCKEFVAEVDSPYNRRFARLFHDVDYQPRVRLFV